MICEPQNGMILTTSSELMSPFTPSASSLFPTLSSLLSSPPPALPPSSSSVSVSVVEDDYTVVGNEVTILANMTPVAPKNTTLPTAAAVAASTSTSTANKSRSINHVKQFKWTPSSSFYYKDKHIVYDGSKCATIECVNNEIRHVYDDVNNKPVFQCRKCNLYATRKSDARKHIRYVHFAEKPYSCNHCAEEFNSKSLLIYHLGHVHQIVYYDNNYYVQKNADANNKIVTPTSTTTPITTTTTTTTMTPTTWTPLTKFNTEHTHMNTLVQGAVQMFNNDDNVSSRFGDKFKCCECGKIFKTMTTLKNHRFGVQYTKNEFVSNTSTDRIDCNSSSNNSCISGGGVSGGSSSSSVDSGRYIDNNNYCTIDNIDKVEGKYYVCGRCNEGFTSACHLQKHLKKGHDTLIIYKCNTCGKSFQKLCNLRRHEMVHQPVKY